MYPEHGTDLNQLFTLADSQMYSDKALSKNDPSILDQEHLEEAIEMSDDIDLVQVAQYSG